MMSNLRNTIVAFIHELDTLRLPSLSTLDSSIASAFGVTYRTLPYVNKLVVSTVIFSTEMSTV